MKSEDAWWSAVADSRHRHGAACQIGCRHLHASDIPAVGQRARDAANTAALRLAAHREKA